MQERFGNDALIQLTTAIGYYSLLCMTVNACELEAGAGAEVLKVINCHCEERSDAAIPAAYSPRHEIARGLSSGGARRRPVARNDAREESDAPLLRQSRVSVSRVAVSRPLRGGGEGRLCRRRIRLAL